MNGETRRDVEVVIGVECNFPLVLTKCFEVGRRQQHMWIEQYAFATRPFGRLFANLWLKLRKTVYFSGIYADRPSNKQNLEFDE